jgi:hypothetical protein
LIFNFHETLSPLEVVIRIKSLQQMIMLDNEPATIIPDKAPPATPDNALKHPLYLEF